MIDLKKLAGFLNTDDPNEVMNAVHHKYARNGRFRGSGANLRFENIPGTTEITNADLPDSGTNECNGAFYDGVKRRLFWFNYNSEGLNGLYMYTVATGVITPLLLSGTHSSDDILFLSLEYPVSMMNLIYRSEGEGDILHWNDRNNRPRKINIKEAEEELYGGAWVENYLTVARPMPLLAPSCMYADDATVETNNLRKKLYEFRYRWIYTDLTKSTISPYSKLFAPLDPDSVATDIDQQKNNRIDVTIYTGPADCIKVEIFARCTQGDSNSTDFSDDFAVALLDKEALGLTNDAIHTFEFFGDGSYLSLLPAEYNQLFDYVPKKANAQELLNGNVLTYGGITFGNTYDEEQDMTVSVELISNAITTNPVTITKVDGQTGTPPSVTGYYYYYFEGDPIVGDVYTIQFAYFDTTGGGASSTITYTVIAGDALFDVITYFRDQMNLIAGFSLTYHLIASNIPGTPSGVAINSTTGTSKVLTSTITINYQLPPTPTSDDVNIAMFKHKSRYELGRVYFDEFGVTNGVITYPALKLEMPEIDTTEWDEPSIPSITVEVNDQPPTWATNFSWVRTDSLTFQRSLPVYTNDIFASVDLLYGYLDIKDYQENQENYPVYGFTEGDRVRIIGPLTTGATVLAIDAPIIDLQIAPAGVGSGTYLKIPYNAATMSWMGGGAFNQSSIEIYTPALSTTDSLQVYYEFGETYPILFPGAANRAHGGKSQDQILNVQPAIYTFIRGDYYIRQRFNETWIVDQSVSTLYPSKISGTGRAFVVDEFAKEIYYPSTYRWGGAYQQETNINQTNRFVPENFDEVDRQKGAIEVFVSKERIMLIFQSRGVGKVGVYNKFIVDSGGSNVLSSSTTIITTNNVMYYVGDFGVGNQYTSVVRSPNAVYFADPIRGYHCRLAENGITPISLIHKGQFYIQPSLVNYSKPFMTLGGYKSRIMGYFDYYEQEYVTIMQAGVLGSTTMVPLTFSYNEASDSYRSFFEFYPEWALCVEDVTFSFLNGIMYKHDNAEYTSFYGGLYGSSITIVFNKEEPVRKTYLAIAYQSNQIWTSDNTGDVKTSMINEQTGLQQVSELKDVDYELAENLRTAAFLKDANSMENTFEALVEGDDLKGQWIEVTLTYNGSEFAWLYEPYVNYILSPRNF